MNSSSFLKSELKAIQDKYCSKVEHGFNVLNLNYFSPDKCLWFVDEVSGFWLENKELLRYVWDRLTESSDCFILSAALNLKVDGNNHYPFKAVGDYQLLHDPFLKLEGLLRAPTGSVNTDELEGQFRYIMKDTLSILRDYSDDFFFVELGLIGQASEEEKIETIHQGWDNFLKELFDDEDIGGLPGRYPTYELIEKKISAKTCKILQFNDSDDAYIPLRDRVEKFIKAQRALTSKSTSGNECERFLLALFCMYSQALDTIHMCLSAGMYPYYRWEIPVKYFYLFMHSHSNHKDVQEIIAKTNGTYFLANAIEQLDIQKIPFKVYRDYIMHEHPYAELCNKLLSDGDQVVKYRPSEMSDAVRPIIERMKSALGI